VASTIYAPRHVLSRSVVLTWLALLVLALVVGVVTWQAFGWFASLRNVVLAALVWATLITVWLKVRRRLYDRSR
jgi:hypothetical protein